MLVKPKVLCRRIGLKPYLNVLEIQRELREKILSQRVAGEEREHTLLICEHPSVISFGSSASEDDLLVDPKQLGDEGFDFVHIRRGGRVTLHNPGQLVGYPILDLIDFKTDIRWFLANLAEVIVLTLEQLGVESFYDAKFPGVWIKEGHNLKVRKVCAIGVHLSRWISNHGFALNVNNNLQPYDYFIPCGIRKEDREITSISKELGCQLSVEEVSELLVANFERVFDCELD